MAKKKKKSTKKVQEKKVVVQQGKSILERLETPQSILIYFAVLFFFLMIFYKPLVFEGLEPGGSDVVSGIGKTHQIKIFEEQTGKRPLWNPYMFGGMPIYQRFGPVILSLDVILTRLDVLVDWRIWYFWAGAIGIFLLIKYLGLSALSGFLASLAFILMPYFHALIAVGHFSKFRAIMWIPFVLLTFLLFLKKKNILTGLLFTFAFALQFRTQHYQIIFYTMLLMLFVGITPYLKIIQEKKWVEFVKFNGLLVASIVLLFLIIAQPLLSIKEYTPYSTRGGQAISLQKVEDSRQKKGVGFDYATNWSYSVPELWNLLIPKFHGGTSQEVYTGKAVPQLRGQQIPAYWGSMPFTQSYEYLGVLIIFLALVGVVVAWNRWEVRSLTFLTFLALLLALGKHFAPLYKLFFYYIPYFDKFRVPMMILTLVMFNISLLAAFGLETFIKGEFNSKVILKRIWILSGVVGFLLIIPLLFGSGFSLSQPQEIQRYVSQFGPDQARQILDMLKQARLDILRSSTLRTLLYFAAGLVLILSMVRNWWRKDWALIALILLAAADLTGISGNYLKGRFLDLKEIERRMYAPNSLDFIIQKDKSMFRVSPPLRSVANDTRWAYYYQSLGGYSPAKLQVIQDIFENNLYVRVDGDYPFNLNILRMMNVKYLADPNKFPDEGLRFLGADQNRKLNLYLNQKNLPRAFFVDTVKVFENETEIVRFMNQSAFDPGKMALLKTTVPVSSPDSSWARVTQFEPDKIEIEAFTDKQALLVLSEVYYPKGWRAFLDGGEELKIYQTNHILRSVVVPAGKHQITLTFRPESYYTGVKLSLVGWLITWAGILLILIRDYREKILKGLKIKTG